MRIFIGSSSEQKLAVYKIKEKIENSNNECNVLPWFNVFPASEYTMESLCKVSREVSCAIFIFANDDKIVNTRGEFTKTRDNVILEYGLFIGTLGIKNVLIVCKDKVDIPSDLKGITYILMNEDFESNLKTWLINVNNNCSREIAIDKDYSIKVLNRDGDGYYYSSVIGIREKLSRKNGKKYNIYKMDGVIDKCSENLVNNESHWICYEDGKFSELEELDKVKFKVSSIEAVKEYEGEKSRNVYVTDVVKL